MPQKTEQALLLIPFNNTDHIREPKMKHSSRVKNI